MVEDRCTKKQSTKKQIDEHPLIWFAESGQKALKDHPTTLKLLRLKWEKAPFYIYSLITLLQFVYLITFTLTTYEGFENNADDKILVGFTFNAKFSMLMVLAIVWLCVSVACVLTLKKIIYFDKISKLNFSLMIIITLMWILFTQGLISGIRSLIIDNNAFNLVWKLSLFFCILNLFYESGQFVYDRLKYFESGKNWLELINIFSSFLILYQLSNPKTFTEYSLLLGKILGDWVKFNYGPVSVYFGSIGFRGGTLPSPSHCK